MYIKRDLERDVYTRNETHEHEKRRTYKRDVHT